MRNQQTPIIRENVFYPEIEPLLCSHSIEKTARPPGKVTMCIIASGRETAASTINHLQARTKKSSATSHPESQQDHFRDKTVIAQPVFVLEKKERPFKRHAGDLVLNSEHGQCAYPEKRFRSSSFTCSPTHSSTETGNSVPDKRVRSSSFSYLTTFPPSQPALKNNVFMSSGLLQEPPKHSSTDCGYLHPWAVMKPATLQPPQVTVSEDVEKTETGTVATRCQQEDKTLTEKISTGQPKCPPGSAYISGLETRMQPFEQMFMPQKYKADFVFGENMDKRVMTHCQSSQCENRQKVLRDAASTGSLIIYSQEYVMWPLLLGPSPASLSQAKERESEIPKRPAPSETSVLLCKRESSSARVSCSRNWPYQKHRLPKSLIESAAAYTSRPRLKYELDQVEIITGEESERNVLQVNCKLFVFNKDNQVWTERGRGYLRLNDIAYDGINGPFRSRIVMRNHGNLKLILNSQIFDEMKLERANRKSLRVTATDLTDSRVKIFLLQASVKDAGRLHAAIHHRLIALRNYKGQKQEKTVPNIEEETESHLQPLSSDDEEEDETTLYCSKLSDHHQWIRRQPVLYS